MYFKVGDIVEIVNPKGYVINVEKGDRARIIKIEYDAVEMIYDKPVSPFRKNNPFFSHISLGALYRDFRKVDCLESNSLEQKSDTSLYARL